jgi:hypothetical protein
MRCNLTRPYLSSSPARCGPGARQRKRLIADVSRGQPRANNYAPPRHTIHLTELNCFPDYTKIYRYVYILWAT